MMNNQWTITILGGALAALIAGILLRQLYETAPKMKNIQSFVHEDGTFNYSTRHWYEYQNGAQYAVFEETYRDATHVYAFDAGRNMDIRFPINGGWCQFRENRKNWIDLYHVQPTFVISEVAHLNP